MEKDILRMQMLAGIITESQYKAKLNEAIEMPTWLKGKLEDVHIKPGQGSIFAKPIDAVLKLAQDALNKETNIDKIANSTGTLTISSPGIGYNLILPIDQAKKLPGAVESKVEKVEGPNKIPVPAITTTAPLTQFKSDKLTIIVRPKKDEGGAVIPNEYIVLSAFPGDPSIPRTSEWGNKYAVIIPGGKGIEEIVNEVLTKYRKQLNENLTPDELEEIVDRHEEDATEESDDSDDIGRMVSERTEEEIQKKYPNITVNYVPSNKGRLYTAFDVNEEEIVAEYTV